MTTTHRYTGVGDRLLICRKDFVMNIRNLGKATQRKGILIAIVAVVITGSNYCDAEDGNGPIDTYTSAIKDFQGTRPWSGSDGRFSLLERKLQFSEAAISYAPAQDNTFRAIKAEGNRGFFKRLLDAYIEEFKGGPLENGPEPPRRALPSPLDSPIFPKYLLRRVGHDLSILKGAIQGEP